MKREKTSAGISHRWIAMSLAIFAYLVSARAQSQSVVPFLDEVIVNPQAQRATAYFGYHNPTVSAFTINIGEPNNYFFPSPEDRGQVTRFLPGTHHYAFAAIFYYDEEPTLTWILNNVAVIADPASAGANTPQTSVFTYQGRLADNNAAANGAYQLRFTLFGTATNGTPIGSPIEMTNVLVTSGLFTVPLDFGSAPFANGLSRFLQIEVRPGPGDSYTTLTPRQPITSVPYATRAFSAATADTATSSQQLSGISANLFVQTSDPRLSDTIGQSVNTVFGTGQLLVSSSTTSYTLIPGLTQTINIPSNSVVVVSTDGGIQSTGSTSNSFSIVDIGIFVDGAVSTSAGQRRLTILNGSGLSSIGNWSMAVKRELAAGNHTFEVKAFNPVSTATSAFVSSAGVPLLQGQLTVTIIKK